MRQEELDVPLLDLFQERAGEGELLVLDLALAELVPLGAEKRVGHRAADQDLVDARRQRLEDTDLVGDLRAADHRDIRTLDLAEQLGQELDLLQHEEPGALVGDVLQHADRRRMRPMRRAERVVHVDVRVRREGAREGVVVGLLARVVAQVLEERDLTVAQVRHDLARAVTDRLVGQDDVAAEQFGQPHADRLAGERRIRRPLGAPPVRPDDQPRAALDEQVDRGQGRPDAGVVGDAARRRERDIEVDPQKDALPLDGEVLDALDHESRSATNRARS